MIYNLYAIIFTIQLINKTKFVFINIFCEHLHFTLKHHIILSKLHLYDAGYSSLKLWIVQKRQFDWFCQHISVFLENSAEAQDRI